VKLALVDIDGVVADDEHRVQFALDKNWPEYFKPETVAKDVPFDIAKTLIRLLLEDGYTISYLTGRREDLRQVTEDWLEDNDFPDGRVVMRTRDQKMPLANFKEEYVSARVASGRYEDVVLFDDDPEVIRFVKAQVGEQHAMLCDWHIKQTALIKEAVA
jgi:hypothetical protein